MLVLISPAKKLDTTIKDSVLPHTQPELIGEAEQLVAVARKLSRGDLGRLMNISDKLADLNYQRFQAFRTPFTPDNAKQGVLAFTGDTYVGLDAGSLNDEDLAYAQDHLRILSGLYGLLRPLDLMQPYRLEMGTKLANPRGEDLYDFWGDRITEAINEAVAGEAEPVVVNLASNEYIKAVKADKLKARFITPVFKVVKDGQARVLGMLAKRARGMMARYIIENRIEDPEQLKGFDADGYRFVAELSDDDRLEFHKPS
ncbi:MAG: peroxide stress protein YaaA [Alphaproteobacteria bacterium]|nr:MAG: peroxide stress protein YaaA [Alphaproteobacteria bacterium]